MERTIILWREARRDGEMKERWNLNRRKDALHIKRKH